MDKQVEIGWRRTELIDWTKLKEFQGELKSLSKENYKRLKKSILKNRFSEPFTVWEDENGKLNLLNGHQRLRCLLMMQNEGYHIPDKLPVSFVIADNLKQAKSIVLSLASQYGEVTKDGLYEFAHHAEMSFEEMKDTFHFPEVNFNEYEKEFHVEHEPDPSEDEVPNVTESISKLGDVYILGDHRLLCGDSTDALAVERLMNGEKADMVFTDPPYGMSLDTDYSKMGKTTTTYKEVIGDSEDFDAKPIFSIEAKQYWLWGADYYCDTIPNYKSGSYIVWTKAHSDNENKVFTSRFELVWVYPKTKKEVWFVRSMQHLHGERTGEHPTQKPIELATRAFERKPEYINIIDLFGGSGSTLIACEKTNRKCFMMELDPHYIDVIVTRWCKYTGRTDVIRNGEPMTWDVE